jgi:hypothetical protein
MDLKLEFQTDIILVVEHFNVLKLANIIYFQNFHTRKKSEPLFFGEKSFQLFLNFRFLEMIFEPFRLNLFELEFNNDDITLFDKRIASNPLHEKFYKIKDSDI